MIRVVLFDILHTVITPRLPIEIQYSATFRPWLGHLEPSLVRYSFKTALQRVRLTHPAYKDGTEAWWTEVIRRTALGAGANSSDVDRHLSHIVPALLHRFSSKEGYKLFDDVSPTFQLLHERNIRIALVSNGDKRMRSVLQDLQLPAFVSPIVLSSEEGAEKPSAVIFLRALQKVNETQPHNELIEPGQCLMVGDDFERDYKGALAVGMHSLLLQRSSNHSPIRYVSDIEIVPSLSQVPEKIEMYNK